MNLTMRCSGELRELLMCLVDPDGPSVDYERLAQLLRDDPAARGYYREFMDLHARLELLHDTPLPMPDFEVSDLIANRVREKGTETFREKFAVSLGRITRLDNCQWRGNPLGVNAQLAPGGVVDIEAGLVDIRMVNGAEVVVEGPAKFSLQTSGSGYLSHGRLSCKVPENDDGFTVLTPSATVVDLGTSFGVWVNDEGATETHVLSGMVGLQPRSSDSSEDTGSVSLVSKLQSARIAPGLDARTEYVDSRVEGFSSLFPSEQSIGAHPSGGLLYSDGHGALFGCHSVNGTRRVGVSSLLTSDLASATNLHLANAFVFRLPNIRVSSQIAAACLEWTFERVDGSPEFSVDLYGLGYLDLRAYRKDWFYEGPCDKSPRSHYGLGSEERTVALLAKSVIGPDSEVGRIAVEGKQLLDFLRSLYRDGARGGDAVVFRLNSDVLLPRETPVSGFNCVHAPAVMGVTTTEELPALKLKVSRGMAASMGASQ